MRTKVSIYRAGYITATPLQATDNQCVANGHNLYYYECKVAALDPHLDERGFIADHNDINRTIQELCAHSIPSCERMALSIAECVSKFLRKTGVKHDEVYVRISSAPITTVGGMEAWYYPEQEEDNQQVKP